MSKEERDSLIMRLSFAYMVCPKKDKKMILKELSKLNKGVE